MHTRRTSLRLRAVPSLCAIGCAALLVGCNTTPTSGTGVRPPRVRALDTSGLADPVDRDRLALSRFVGAWDFEGWYDPPGESRRTTEGRAAATIEHNHFIMLDTARAVEQADDVEYSVGSMLLSVEPGIGLMATAWSSDTPAIHRLGGSVEAGGSRFVFKEFRTVGGRDRVRAVMRFETDDRWVLEFSRKSSGQDVIAASYTFTRAP